MFENLFTAAALDLIYAAVLVISFIFAVISLIGAEVGELIDFDADTDLDFINISPFALAIFGAAFGLTGLITHTWADMNPIPSIVWSSVVGLVVGIAAQAFFIYVLSPSKSSHFSLADDATGREAEVIISVPDSGLGTIAYDNVSGRVTLGARSATGKPISNGQVVRIERVTGRVAVVRPVEENNGSVKQKLL